MHWHTVNYLAQRETPQRGTLMDRGFWLSGIRRPLLTCRTFGHKPVVDGTGPYKGDGRLSASRWVCCDRCGVRPQPQGGLDPTEWNVGDRYTGAFDGVSPDWDEMLREKMAGGQVRPTLTAPGPWPDKPTWKFGGQAIVGKTLSGFSAEVKVGNCGSEQDLAAHVSISPLGALYVHTEDLGKWLQRRLNPTGYESRVIGFSAHDGTLYWKLWAPRDSHSVKDPRWQQGSIGYDLRDRLLGRKRYWHTNEGDPVTTTVRLPHGDDHQVTLQLQRREHGREKLTRRELAWSVDWDTQDRGGIPTKPNGRGRVSGAGIEVSDASVRKGTWPLEAAAAIARSVTAWRTREGMGVQTAEASA